MNPGDQDNCDVIPNSTDPALNLIDEPMQNTDQ